MSMNKMVKVIWIEELRGLGVTHGPNGERLENMNYQDIKYYLVVKQEQNGTGIDLDAKANAFF